MIVFTHWVLTLPSFDYKNKHILLWRTTAPLSISPDGFNVTDTFLFTESKVSM